MAGVFAAHVIHDEEPVAPSVQAGLHHLRPNRDTLPTVGVRWSGVAEAPNRSALSEDHGGQVRAILRPAGHIGLGPLEGAGAQGAGVAGPLALDPFLGNGRDGDASQRFGAFEVDGEDRLGDALTLELRRVEIDEEELLMAL